MKQQLKKLTAVVASAAVVTVGGIIGLSALAESNGVQTTLDVSQGSITITDTSVSGKDGSGTEVTTVDPDGYVITGTTTENTITVSGTQNIVLDRVNIDVSEKNYTCAFKIEDNNTGTVTVTLADDSVNTLKSGYNCAGLQKNGDGAGIGKLIIKGGANGTGKLTATSGYYGAGIGSGYSAGASDITISGGIVTATGVLYGPGIGSGDGGSTSDITISGGTVTAKGGTQGAGIGCSKGGSASDITISGGTVTAKGGSRGAGIGGGYSAGASDITISGGIVSVKGGNYGAGIGGGYSAGASDITISGGIVTAEGGIDAAGIGGGSSGSGTNITISGGSVKAVGYPNANDIGGGNGKSAVAPTLADGTTKVFLSTIDTGSVTNSIVIDGVEYPTTHNGEAKIYPYFSEGFHTIVIDGTTKEAIYMSNEGSATSYSVGTVGAFEVYGGTLNTDYSYSGNVLTISGGTTPLMIKNTDPNAATTDKIEVASGISANITLAGINIDVSGTSDACAFKIADGSTGTVTITLASGSVNKLISGKNCAGLQKNGTSGYLEIKGTGALTATGGANAAGIGGGKCGDGSGITISGGTVTATGGDYGAGIGGGSGRSGSSIIGGSGTNITISGGTVTATGGENGAGIGGGTDGNCSDINISGGTVNAASTDYGAGIGGGKQGTAMNINISGGTVTATGGDTGAGIGGGDEGNGSVITISGGIVTATGVSGGAGIGGGIYGVGSDIIISGGSVLAQGGIFNQYSGAAIGNGIEAVDPESYIFSDGTYVTPTDGTENVYPLVVDNPNKQSVTVDGTPYFPTDHGDGKLYLYLTARSHTITVGEEVINVLWDSLIERLLKEDELGTDLTVTLTDGTGDPVYGVDYSYLKSEGVLTILSDTAMTIANRADVESTANTIVIAADINADITLAGVNINVSGTDNASAFKIADGSQGNVTVTLADGTENTLTSGNNCAGLQKNGDSADIGKLTITGTGSLTAIGGDGGAGIGGGNTESASNITISGGTVTATGGDMGAGIGGNNRSGSNIIISGGTVIANGGNGGAGIGGGTGGSGSDITISGGSVTAKSNGGGAGIGGGERGKGSNITISGGTVTATGGWDAAGIGSGNGVNEYNVSGSNITISGGTVTANGGDRGAGIGGGNDASGSNITISGGSVKAVAGSEANAIGGGKDGNGAVTPTNGTNEVYLLEIANDSSEAVTIDGKTYPTSHDGEKNIYAYLTGETHIIKVGEETYLRKFNSASKEFAAPDLTITGEVVYGTDYTLVNDTFTINTEKPITISGTTTSENVFVAKDVSANITLDGVNIDVSSISETAAFKIEDDSTGNVTITLADDSENTLKSGEERAGLQKNGSRVIIGTLTIQGGANGTGTLTATGGDRGAGIGGGYMGAAKNITIERAIITAKGASGIGSGNQGGGVDGIQIINSTVKATGSGGAGIGGSDDSYLSNLIISNSTVTATGGASGIGGGTGGSTYEAGDCTNVTIEDSVVVATGSGGAGIGTGNPNEGYNRNGDGFSSCNNITIINSVVTAKGSVGAAGIGGGVMGKCENVEIYGSSVIAEGNGVPDIGWGKYYEDPNNPSEENTIYGKAVNATSSGNKVYPFTIANPTGAAVTIDGTEYAYANHSAADENDTNLYAYLTGEAHTVTIGEVTTEYMFYDGIFLPVPKASDFTFTAPTDLKYTGTAKAATVTADKTGMGEITAVKYYNASGDEVTQGAVVPGTYTVKIDVAKGDKYAEATDITADDWTFTITTGDLTVSGTGKASGTFGDKLSELTVSGLTAKFGDTEIEGTWALSGNTIPNVGDTTKYTATFTPSENADWYNELTAEVSLDIAKADAPEIEDIELTYNWAATGEKTTTVSGLPDNMGTIGTAVIDIDDENGIIKADSAVYGQGRLRFTLNGFDSEKKDISAVIKVTLPTQNYKDTTFSVIVSITAKLDKDAPAESEFELAVDLLSDNTYKVTITTALTGVEFSFDGVNWSSTNTKAVNHAETVTGYIRYAETDEYNASPYSSKTAATGHGTLTHHDAKAATCTEDGNIEYWTCDSCKLYFSDENGKTEITQEQTVLTKLGHKWAETYNFDKDGHWHKCTVCGDTSEKEAHISGGAATADSAEICTVCGYEIAPKIGQIAAPLFTPNGGIFTEVQTVTITSATEGAEIYYTTDGKDPTTSSTKYTGAITIGKTTTIKAVAVKDGMTYSTVVTAEFTINLPVKETVATPAISPNGGSFSGSQTVTITCATEGAKIYYTTDGSAPTTNSKPYTGAFTISATTTVKAIAVKDGMVDSEIATATFTKKSSGGGGGGGGGHRPSTPTEPNNPSIGGSSKSWSDISADLSKLTNGSETTIQLNGNTTVPLEVIKAIADKDSKVTFVIDSVFSWVIDGAEITTPVAIDLTLIKTASTNHDGLRGIEGTQFKINGTNIPTDLEIAFIKAHAGKFANLYKVVDGKLVFVTCAKLGEDGKVILPDVVEKGEYVVMLCEFSDRLGDMDNDGIMNAKDAAAILKDIVEIEPGKNPLMADFNGDGKVNAMDAAAILKIIVGLA